MVVITQLHITARVAAILTSVASDMEIPDLLCVHSKPLSDLQCYDYNCAAKANIQLPATADRCTLTSIEFTQVKAAKGLPNSPANV